MPVDLREVGAMQEAGEIIFCVWAPFSSTMEVEIIAPTKQIIPLSQDESGYWSGNSKSEKEEVLYKYSIDKKLSRPDPASRYQPEGIHGPSSTVIDSFEWRDSSFKQIPVGEMIIYELHTGTFTHKNNFDGIKDKIPYLKDLGINTVELMPVGQFPGNRNWGYDGSYPFAVQNSYGGPEKLRELVNECHKENIAVIMDVVYNHLGPEGNYLNDFGPYFTEKYKTPWGKALNFDDAYSDPVRNYFIQNVIMWFRKYHIDALRLDAVHAILDTGARPFLLELKEITENISREDGKNYQLIAESDLNDVRIINSFAKGGFNHDAQWMDDFHHCVHTLVTDEKNGYYEDFGSIEQLVKCFNIGYVYNGIYSGHRKKTFGSNSENIPRNKFVVYVQNHDQVGNRAKGERLSSLVSFEKLKLAAACMILSPYVPMLFMGEEYGEENPFLYFISHSDNELVKAVREGRKKEFASFDWKVEVPDPHSGETFEKSILAFNFVNDNKKLTLFNYYKFLIELKKSHPLLIENNNFHAGNENELLIMRRNNNKIELSCYLNFSEKKVKLNNLGKRVKVILNSNDKEWDGVNEAETALNKLFLEPFGVLLLEQKNE